MRNAQYKDYTTPGIEAYGVTEYFPDDPINRVVWLPAVMLTANNYNPNIVFNKELDLLELSLLKSGWLQPILIAKSGEIIDGFHRWSLSQRSVPLKKKYDGLVPCVVMDLSRHEAIMLTVRINRAKGTHVALKMSDLVKELIDVHSCDRQSIADSIGANLDEIDLLYQDSIFEAKNMKDYRYSNAWVPVETTRRGVHSAD